MYLLTPKIMKQNTVMGDAISPHEKLTATLRFLATGRTYEDFKFNNNIFSIPFDYHTRNMWGGVQCFTQGLLEGKLQINDKILFQISLHIYNNI